MVPQEVCFQGEMFRKLWRFEILGKASYDKWKRWYYDNCGKIGLIDTP